jgi:YD repeat-containing protein
MRGAAMAGRTRLVWGLGLGAAVFGLAMAAPAAAQQVCPAVQQVGPGSVTVAEPGGAPGNCYTRYDDRAVTLSGRTLGYAHDSFTGTTYAYDQHGNLVEETYAGGAHTEFHATGTPLTTVTDPLGHTTRFTYDANDNVLSVTNAAGRITSYVYDADNRVIDTSDTLGRTTSYGYDADGRMVTTSQSTPSSTTSYTYNPTGTLSQYDADGNVTTYTYSGGELTEIDGPGSTVTQYFYDADNRVVKEVDSSPSRTLTYTYDADGNVTSQTDSLGGVTSFIYDGFDRMIKEIDPGGGTYQMQYDAVGNEVRLTDPGGLVTTYVYDEHNRLVGERGPTGEAGTAFAYTPEPATWGLMLLGFTAVGYGLRRRVRSRLSAAV